MYYNLTEAVVPQGQKGVIITRQLWVQSPLDFHFFTVAARQKPSVEFCQCLERKSAESVKRSVSTLDSLCLPCCMRDTA